jgi:hypothetical protein
VRAGMGALRFLLGLTIALWVLKIPYARRGR